MRPKRNDFVETNGECIGIRTQDLPWIAGSFTAKLYIHAAQSVPNLRRGEETMRRTPGLNRHADQMIPARKKPRRMTEPEMSYSLKGRITNLKSAIIAKPINHAHSIVMCPAFAYSLYAWTSVKIVTAIAMDTNSAINHGSKYSYTVSTSLPQKYCIYLLYHGRDGCQ